MHRATSPKKRFGQNFLTDDTVINRIYNALMLGSNRRYIEIGPGLGALTAVIAPVAKSLTLVEIDRDLLENLKKSYDSPHIQIIGADCLSIDLDDYLQQIEKTIVFGNLPYNISTPLLFKCMPHCDKIDQMVFMLQKEVVDRITAQPGTKTYGRLTVMLNYHCSAERLFNVPKTAFHPAPKIMSSVVRLIPHANIDLVVTDYEHFSIIVREAFNHRRKTINNALKGLVTTEAFSLCNIDPRTRPETLSTQQFVSLSNASC